MSRITAQLLGVVALLEHLENDDVVAEAVPSPIGLLIPGSAGDEDVRVRAVVRLNKAFGIGEVDAYEVHRGMLRPRQTVHAIAYAFTPLDNRLSREKPADVIARCAA